jgi:hypothetical protein
MYFNSRSSDQKGERFMHVVVFSVGSAIAFALLAMVVRFHLSVFLGFWIFFFFSWWSCRDRYLVIIINCMRVCSASTLSLSLSLSFSLSLSRSWGRQAPILGLQLTLIVLAAMGTHSDPSSEPRIASNGAKKRGRGLIVCT